MSKPPPEGKGQIASISITPDTLSLAVGATAVLTATYLDTKGVAFAVDDQPTTMWGCEPQTPELADGCYAIVQILPTAGAGEKGDPGVPSSGATATITGLAAGACSIYAADGLGRRVSIPVTVA